MNPSPIRPILSVTALLGVCLGMLCLSESVGKVALVLKGPETVFGASTNSDGDTLTVTTTDAITITDATDWTVTASDGATPELTYSSGSGSSTIVFSCSPRIGGGATYTLTYGGGGTTSGLAAFSDSAITNNSVKPTPPVEYSVPSIPATLAALESGATVITPADSTELDSLCNGGTVDSTTLAAAEAAGPVVIKLDKTVTYSGPFWFPVLSDTNWVYVVSDGYDLLPATGTRVDSADSANLVEIHNIDTPGDFQHPAVNLSHGSSKYRFIGVEFHPYDDGVIYSSSLETTLGCLQCGYGALRNQDPASTLSELPADIIVDRCWFVGRDTEDDRYAIVFNVRGGAIIDTLITDFNTPNLYGAESSAVFIYLGGGPYLLENCGVSGAGENVIFGGTDSAVENPNATDIVIRHCYLWKEQSWFATSGTFDGHNRYIKNLLEFKKVHRALVEGCILEDVGENEGGQSETAVVMTVRNQSGTDTDAQIKDIEFKDSIIRRCGIAFRITNQDDLNDSLATERVWIHNNLCEKLGYWTVSGVFMGLASNSRLSQKGKYVFITHNTTAEGTGGGLGSWHFIHTGSSEAWDGTYMENNLFEVGRISGTADPGPTNSMNQWHDNWTVNNNAAYNYDFDALPVDNWDGSTIDIASDPPATPDADDVQFVDYANGDYELDPDCAYAAGNARDATDGTDLGADIGAIETATANTISGDWN